MKKEKNKGMDELSEEHVIFDNNIIPDPIKKKESSITLNKYLTDFSKNHSIDNVIKYWYAKKEPKTVKKSKNEWDKIIEDFFKEEAI